MANLFKSSRSDSHPVPGIASAIFPGLGQLLKGHLFKAIMFWIAVPLVWWIVGWIPLVGWLAGAFAWLVNVLDATFSNNKG